MRWWLWVVVVVAAGCGDDSDLSAAAPAPDAGCLNCEMQLEESERVLEVMPHLAAEPRQLLFYGDELSGLTSQLTKVANHTRETVYITRAYVVDDPLSLIGAHGSDYFTIRTPTFPTPLIVEDQQGIEVSFRRSTHERSALLVIETNHPDFSSLIVTLSGKYFLHEL